MDDIYCKMRDFFYNVVGNLNHKNHDVHNMTYVNTTCIFIC